MEFFDFKVITGSLPEFWRGLWMTVQLTGLALLFGFFVAIPLAVMRTAVAQPCLVSAPGRGLHLLLPRHADAGAVAAGILRRPQGEWMRAARRGRPASAVVAVPRTYFCALFAFGLNTCAYTVEILAGSMRNMPHGELEAAKAMGMTRLKAAAHRDPVGATAHDPSYSNEVILMLQVGDRQRGNPGGPHRCGAQRVFAPLRAFESFVFVGLIYLALTFALVGCSSSPSTAGSPTWLRASGGGQAVLINPAASPKRRTLPIPGGGSPRLVATCRVPRKPRCKRTT